MRKLLAGVLFSMALGTGACAPHLATAIKVDQVKMGRVVVYRNGVAFYERRAQVTGGRLTVTVPRDRVDDFLKSLTVVDANTNQPLPVSFPRQEADYGAYLEMSLELPSKAPADVLLTYVTESPAWKPSYRIVVGEDKKTGKKTGKVMLEGWAIVDNTSGEDWNGVIVGVGSSSALSFRYDLWNVRNVARETLQTDAQFAIAPPTGVAPFASGQATVQNGAIAELTDEEIRPPAGHPDDDNAERLALDKNDGEADEDPYRDSAKSEPAPEPTMVAGIDATGTESLSVERSSSGYGVGSSGGWSEGSGKIKARGNHRSKKHGNRKADEPTPGVAATTAPPPESPVEKETKRQAGDSKLRAIVDQARASGNTIVIDGVADATKAGAEQRALDRANIVRNQLIDAGIAPAQVKVVTHVEAGQPDRVRLAQEAPPPGTNEQPAPDGKAAMVEDGPVGESQFESIGPMTVGKGTSAMVSMVRRETDGEVVYLYDAESARGNDKFAFKAVRLRNPTDSTLETGPVTVYGKDRFIGEGLSEPIPPRSQAVIPFALDREIVVDKDENDDNQISKLITLQRGVLTAEVQHIKRTHLTITNRSADDATVFIRHTVGKGWVLKEHPEEFDRVGDSLLFQIKVKAGEVKTFDVAEATPLERTLDLNSEVALDMMKVYVEAPEPTGELRDQLNALLAIHRDIVDGTEKIESLRRRMVDYRDRMDELHGQLLTLQAVKTSGDLMKHLKDKLKDISERVQKATIEVVDTEEALMMSRVQFQDALAELKLGDALAPPVASTK